MNVADTARRIDAEWTGSIEPALARYIAIPNKSPMFDPEWQAHGHMERAVALLLEWCRAQPVKGLAIEAVRLPGRTPLLLAEIPGTAPGSVLLYGHFDKQPEFSGWEPGLGPWTPVVRDGRLYGRGGADDGYALFSSLLAIRTLQEQGVPHARCVILIEGSEESGSDDLPVYQEQAVFTPDMREVIFMTNRNSPNGSWYNEIIAAAQRTGFDAPYPGSAGTLQFLADFTDPAFRSDLYMVDVSTHALRPLTNFQNVVPDLLGGRVQICLVAGQHGHPRSLGSESHSGGPAHPFAGGRHDGHLSLQAEIHQTSSK
jgi:hypothetical protein